MVQGDIINNMVQGDIERLSIQRNAALSLRCSFRWSIFDSKRAPDTRCGSITISQATRRIKRKKEVVASSNNPAIAHCAPWSTVTQSEAPGMRAPSPPRAEPGDAIPPAETPATTSVNRRRRHLYPPPRSLILRRPTTGKETEGAGTTRGWERKQRRHRLPSRRRCCVSWRRAAASPVLASGAGWMASCARCRAWYQLVAGS
ncbi:hypothetical protein C4D60_Mb08t21150 [Musa balbisiana]|uniref:Uncharacterized protein n=1 Tax=Musa balbisiana TaxID=52838 RepID=A0A4S8K5H3_MUSBA|nr:hypothetical protein C4D60_Mb08t21150 [Musa balbisiana]